MNVTGTTAFGTATARTRPFLRSKNGRKGSEGSGGAYELADDLSYSINEVSE